MAGYRWRRLTGAHKADMGSRVRGKDDALADRTWIETHVVHKPSL